MFVLLGSRDSGQSLYFLNGESQNCCLWLVESAVDTRSQKRWQVNHRNCPAAFSPEHLNAFLS